MRLRGNSITGSNINSGIMNNNTNNHHDNNGEERSSHFSNYYGGSKPPDVSSSSTPKRKTTGRRKSSFTAKLFSSSKPTNNNNHNESSQQQQNREMLFSADGMLPDPRCEMRAMIECQQQQQHQQQRSEYYPQQQHLKPGVYAANNNNVSAAERFKYGDGHNNIPPNRAAEEVTEHHDTHHHEHDDIIAVTNSANRFKFGIQQLQQQQQQQQQYDIRRGSGGSVSTLTKSSAGEDTFHTPSPPGTTAAAAAVTATNRNLLIGKYPFANYKIDDDDDDNCDDHDDDSGGRQPYTRPSCPQYKRTTNMGLSTPVATTTTTSSSGSCSNMNNGYCAFDVNATRAELLSKLEGKRRKGGGGGGPTLKCSTVQEIDEDLLRESTASSSFFTQTQTPPPPEFRGSLRDCLIGMGFDDDAIIKAMVACNASESKDVENVIEWLDDHREVVGVGEGAVRSGDDAYYHHHHDDNNNNNKINHESFCDEESHYTQTSLHTRTSHGTAQTEESNEEIRILAHSLKDLGFDHVEIREKKELYRRASKNNGLLNAEGFIAAMFEVDDEIVGSSSSSSRVIKSRVKSEPLLAGDDHDNHDGNDWKRSASLSHHRKQRNQTDSELFSFLSAMGFSMEKIESAIQSLRNEGTNDIIDAEAVVAVLLSQQHEEKSRSSSGGALLPLVTLDNSHGGSSKPTTADELEQNEFMKIEVTPGNFAPVLKARQTVQAISDGTAVSVRCTVCSVTLQCCPDAEYVLCPDCDVVSPILSQYRRLASSDRVAGSDGSSSQSSHHSARSNRRMSTGGMIGAIGLGKKSRR